MAHLLYVEAAPLKPRSHSIHVASEFLKAYGEINRQDELEVIDLWQTKLPPFAAAVETLEQPFEVGGGDARAAIAHADLKFCAGERRVDGDAAAGR